MSWTCVICLWSICIGGLAPVRQMSDWMVWHVLSSEGRGERERGCSECIFLCFRICNRSLDGVPRWTIQIWCRLFSASICFHQAMWLVVISRPALPSPNDSPVVAGNQPIVSAWKQGHFNTRTHCMKYCVHLHKVNLDLNPVIDNTNLRPRLPYIHWVRTTNGGRSSRQKVLTQNIRNNSNWQIIIIIINIYTLSQAGLPDHP